jgi:hypothetical protein
MPPQITGKRSKLTANFNFKEDEGPSNAGVGLQKAPDVVFGSDGSPEPSMSYAMRSENPTVEVPSASLSVVPTVNQTEEGDNPLASFARDVPSDWSMPAPQIHTTVPAPPSLAATSTTQATAAPPKVKRFPPNPETEITRFDVIEDPQMEKRVSKIFKYQLSYPELFGDHRIPKTATVTDLDTIINRMQSQVQVNNCKHVVDKVLLSVLGMSEFVAKAKGYNIDGLTADLMTDQEFKDLVQEMSLKHGFYDRFPVEARLVLHIAVKAQFRFYENKAHVNDPPKPKLSAQEIIIKSKDL